MSVKLEQAEKIIKAAQSKAAELGIRVSVAVVDAGGHLIAIRRMDGARVTTPDMARGKAFSSLILQRESGDLMQMPFYSTGPEVGGGRMVPFPGGIPIREGDQVIGAVGVGGGTGEQDVECARTGLAAL